MSDTPQLSRRNIIKFLASAPLLPLGAFASASVLSACGGSDAIPVSIAADKSVPASYVASSFEAMAAPSLSNPAAMATTTVGSSFNVTFSDQSTQNYKLAYETFFVTGDMVPDGKGGKILSGGYVDIYNQPIYDDSVTGKNRQFFSDAPDGTSLLQLANPTVTGIKGKAVFAVVQFEYTTRDQANLPKTTMYGRLPSPIAVLTLDQDQTTGKLTLVKYHNVDTSAAHGLWITCGASLSPWNTHLSSEEYEPDAPFAADDPQFKAFSANLFGAATPPIANPYHYGHLPEVTVNPDGSGTIKKHYCMGRISHELVQVMPDNRTVLMGDDATNSALFMFIADKEKDLSAGTLYAAKLGDGFSIDPAAAGCSVSWINLGHATSAEIEKMANTLKPSDIMDVSKTEPNPNTGYTKVFLNGTANWVKVVPGMEKAAAFLETHRYAYLAGASMGFSKMEGTTVNIKDKIAYSALQNMQDSMVRDNISKGWNEASGIALDKALVAGGVMAHTLVGGQIDLIAKSLNVKVNVSGKAIDSEWVAVQMKALLVGEDLAIVDDLGNKANADKIANPDNLKFSEKLRTLFIGEDSGSHVNNFLWAYNVDTKLLSRIMSMPAGGEATGLHVVDDLNGWTYIMSNFQHAGDWDTKIPGLHDKVKATLDPLVKANYKERFGAAVGYLTATATGIRTTKG